MTKSILLVYFKQILLKINYIEHLTNLPTIGLIGNAKIRLSEIWQRMRFVVIFRLHVVYILDVDFFLRAREIKRTIEVISIIKGMRCQIYESHYQKSGNASV